MITSGAPVNKEDSLQELLQLALLIVRIVPQVVRDPLTLDPLNLRVGIHTGEVVGGVVGSVMPRYTFSGDTVNLAARMQQLASPRSVLVSAVTAGKFACLLVCLLFVMSLGPNVYIYIYICIQIILYTVTLLTLQLFIVQP